MVGPTAVGKSGLAVEVAARCGAEIVGADAFQVYAGFDLLTAKPSPSEWAKVRHHLIGIIPPGENYNVARYLNDAETCLRLIQGTGKPAIVVGGTGLYLKALTHGLSPLPQADHPLRAELETLDTPALMERLHALDPVSANTIDGDNKRRLVRAIEVCLLTEQPFSSHRTLWNQPPPISRSNGVLLVRSRSDLLIRIEERVAAMFEHGVIEEVRAAMDLPLSETASHMIGLQDIHDLLDGRQTVAECREKIVVSTRQYAKRQVTWFQREKHFERLDLSTLSDDEAVDFLCARVMTPTSQTPLDGGALRN